MGSISLSIPQAGQPNATEDVKVASNFTTLQTLLNGNVDTNNLSPTAGIKPSQVAGAAVPVGSLMHYAGAGDPADPDGVTRWLVCDGRPISRSTYAALFTAVTTIYGSGNGTTTFNIPDLRGRAAVGADPGGINLPSNHPALAASGGEETHTLLTGEMPAHGHTGSSTNGSFLQYSGGGSTANPAGSAIGAIGVAVSVGNTGGGSAHNNLQPYLAVNHIIKVI